jgi:hypothetical protein
MKLFSVNVLKPLGEPEVGTLLTPYQIKVREYEFNNSFA